MTLEPVRESWAVDDIRDAVRNCEKLAGPIRDAILALLSTIESRE